MQSGAGAGLFNTSGELIQPQGRDSIESDAIHDVQ